MKFVIVFSSLVSNGAVALQPSPNLISPANAQFVQACADGDIDTMELSLVNGADIHYEDSKGVNALDLAFQNGHSRVVNVLVDMGVEPRFVNFPELLFSSFGGREQSVTDLLKGRDRHFISDKDKYGDTALHWACKNEVEHLGVVNILLTNKACTRQHVNAPGRNKWTALQHAASMGHLDTVHLLLRKGAQLIFPVPDGSGFHALHVAAFHGYSGTRWFLRVLFSYRCRESTFGLKPIL